MMPEYARQGSISSVPLKPEFKCLTLNLVMVKLYIVVLTIFLSLLGCARAKNTKPEPNAYRIVLLDSKSIPLASATIVMKEFKLAEQKENIVKCQIKLFENLNTAKEVVKFKSIIPTSGEREVSVQTSEKPDFGGAPGLAGHVLIGFNPGVEDSNIHVILRLDKDEKTQDGEWSYATFAGGSEGGTVQVTRIRVE
jgi:hypothetical protein